jgi:hypothetical protein
MKKLAFLALSVFVVASMSASVMANDVVVASDAAGTSAEVVTPGFATFNLYVIGQEIGQVTGWEIGMAVPAGWTVLLRTVNNGPGVNPGGDDNYLIGLGNCYGDAGMDYLFVTYNMGFFGGPVAPQDAVFCLIPPNGGLPPASGFFAYTSCQNQIVPMGAGNLSCDGGTTADGCAVINPSSRCVVATEPSTWGAVKAAY